MQATVVISPDHFEANNLQATSPFAANTARLERRSDRSFTDEFLLLQVRSSSHHHPCGDSTQTRLFEHNPAFAQVAQGNFRKTGIHDRVESIQQSGRDAMTELTEQVRNKQQPPYGLVLLDLEDTSKTLEFIDMAIELCSPKACILVHCALRLSDLAKETPDEPNIRAKASREIMRSVRNDSRIDGGLFMCSGDRDYDLLYITLAN